MTDIIIGKELLIDVIATLQENSVAANKVKKDLSDNGQLTKFREMELETITEGSEAAINDIENSLKNSTKVVDNKIEIGDDVSKIIKHLEILRNAQKHTTGLPNEELDELIVKLKTKRENRLSKYDEDTKYEYKEEPLIKGVTINIPKGSILIKRQRIPQWTCDVVSWLQPIQEEKK